MKRLLRAMRKYALQGVGVILISVLTALYSISDRGIFLTNKSFDILRTTKDRSEVVIVGIDDKSLQALGSWPWDRSVFARLTKELSDAQVKSLNFDVLFLESRSGDREFGEALEKAKMPVVLASKIDDDKYLKSFFLENGITKDGIVNVLPDADGKVRTYTLPVNKEGCLLPLSEVAFTIATRKQALDCQSDAFFFRYPKNILTLSLIDILNGEVNQRELTGKTIFVGATSLDLLDTFVGMDGEKIPGVHIHASQFVSKLNQVYDKTLTPQTLVFIIMLLGVLSGGLFTRLASVLGQIVTYLGLLVSTLILAVIFFDFGIILPWMFMIALLTLLLGYIALVQMITERKKNIYIESLFSKYVHKDVLKELMNSSSSLRFDGEKRNMTILFSDLRGFTTLSESLSPEDLTKTLNAYFSAMTPCILNERGTIDKFIGDAIMAFWNAPLQIKNHEMHAVVSAVSMIEALAAFNKKNNTSLAIGIGIHAGEAVVGNVGSSDRVNYTVLGDTVNLSSRIESLTKKYGASIIISETVKKQIETSRFLIRKLDQVIVKGKNTPTMLYEILEPGRFTDSQIRIYEEAFEFYTLGKFKDAEKLFVKLQEIGDKASMLMLERIKILVERHEEWNGVWVLDEK